MGDTLKHKKPYTWADYCQTPEGQYFEIINGEAYDMAAAPSVRHQEVSGEIFSLLHSYFKGKKCRVLPTPIDVKLSDIDIVQPDIIVVCDPDKIKETHIDGTPDLVIEVLSPSTEVKDRRAKLKLYVRCKVKEYWLIKPFPCMAEVYVLDGDTYKIQGIYDRNEVLESILFPELKINLKDIFSFPLNPEEEKIYKTYESQAVYGKQ